MENMCTRIGHWMTGIVCFLSLGMTLAVDAQSEAETVSVWKLERDIYNSGKTDCNSLLNQVYDFSSAGSCGRIAAPFTGTPATLPDGLAFLEDTDNQSAVKVSGGVLRNSGIIPYLELTNSWTVEGWYSWPNHPASGSWRIVFGTRNSGDGWFVTHRNHGGVLQFELYSQGTSGDAITDGTVLWGNIPEELTNTWKHLALTYDADGTGTPGKGVWKFYVDGENTATVTNRTAVTGKINNSAFYIGGRGSGSNNTSTFSADYWRVTRGVLTPEQFLNASGVKPTSVSDTVAYYRLDQEGEFNNVAGSAYRLSADFPFGDSLSQAFNYIPGLNLAPSMMQPFDRCPNPSVDLVNSGSVRIYGTDSRLVDTKLGEMLEADKPFTIEGWVYRIGAPSNLRGWTMMFGTRARNTGFALWYGLGGKPGFGMYYDTTGGVMRADIRFPKASSTAFENEWKHIALTQTPNGCDDKTVWELFLDGESMGCVTGVIASANLTNQKLFYIGSRPNDALGAGYYDCFRVCSRVLSPNEFLNATNGVAVASTDILAFWPLDTINNGLYLDLHDIRGNYPFGKLTDFSGRVTTSSEQAVETVPNPDASVLFGAPAGNHGSVSFPDSGKPNYLCVMDNIGRSFLSLTNDFTVESWINYQKLPTGWSIVYGAGYNAPRWGLWIRNNNDVVKYMMIAQKTGGSYLVNDNTFFAKNGVNAAITSADLNLWHHVALVYRADEGNGTFELFIDGISKGTIELLSAPPAEGTGITGDLFVGGRPIDNHSLIANIDQLRVSRVALTPERFLNANVGNQPIADAPKTLAYWPLEYDGTSVDASDKITGKFPFTYAAAPVGTNLQFRAEVGNPDKTEGFIGNPTNNAGSVLNTLACVLHSTGLRAAVSVFSPAFTAEGWIRWSGQGTLPQAIVGNHLEYVCGWSLSLTGEKQLRLIVQEAQGWELANRIFDTGNVSLADRWRHVAVTYSRAMGKCGGWEVFLDGKSLGTVENAYAPRVTDGVNGSFGIGAQSNYTPFDGLLDCWRLSDGVLAPADFLYVRYPEGTIITFR